MLIEQPRKAMVTSTDPAAPGTRTRAWSEIEDWQVVTAVTLACAV